MITGIVKKGSNIEGTIRQSTISVETSNIVKGIINVAEMPEPQYEEYSGSYDINPTKTKQVLATQYKLMSQDLSVSAIAYHEKITATGGKIVTIGSD